MAGVARAEIEALLRARKLDATLTTGQSRTHEAAISADLLDEYAVPTGITALDERLHGGLPRGQMSEIVGAPSSGRTSVVMAALAGATTRGELAALVDTFDTFDPASARVAGVDLARLLWVRGHSVPAFGPQTPDFGPRTSDLGPLRAQSLDRALKSFNLILQAGGFGLVVLDLADASSAAIRRLPFTTWLRLQRPVEGSTTACVLLGSEPIARSAGGVTVTLRRVDAHAGWSRLFRGLHVEASLARARGLADACRFHLASAPTIDGHDYMTT